MFLQRHGVLRCIQLLSAICFLQWIRPALALSTVTGSVSANATNPIDIGAFAQLSQTGAPHFRADIGERGQFYFNLVQQGEYVLSIHSRRAIYPTYAVHVGQEADDVSVSVYVLGRGVIEGSRGRLPTPIPVIEELIYTDPPRSFSLIHLARSNPTILMLVVGGLAAMGLPYLLQMLDPEITKEVQEQQSHMHNQLASLQSVDGLSKMLSSAGTSGSGTSTPELNKGGGSGKKKRR